MIWPLFPYAVVLQLSSPPLVLPHPLSFPGGGGGFRDRHLVNRKFLFQLTVLLLCCCLGDCGVRHCLLYPLYSWQASLLSVAETERDSTTMFTPGMNVMSICSKKGPCFGSGHWIFRAW